MSILDKIQNFNWLRFNDIGKEVSKLAGAVQGIALDARKLGKDASAEQIAGLITRIRGLKDGTTIDELLGQLLGGAESIFDEHADERAELLKKGQKQSDDLDAPQDKPKPPVDPPIDSSFLDSDPGMQPFPKDVYITRTNPPWYVIHSGTIGDPVPSQFSPVLPENVPGWNEPGWHILHNSQRS